jgi:phenylacetic acid degradation operon negative regulatory protein
LVDLAADFDISQAGARTVLTRLARDERVSVTKEGRRTFYELTPWMRRRLGTGLERMRTFGRESSSPERWTCVAFSVPEEQRAARHKLRTGLQWLGFAPWYDGLWISPTRASASVEALVAGLEIGAVSVFEASLKSAGPVYGRPTDAWDLPAIRATYEHFLEETAPALARLRAGDVDDVEALAWRTQLVNVWRLVPGLDPGLPLELLPRDWPRERARSVFEELYAGLAPGALRRVRQAVRRHAPERLSHAEVHDLGVGA